MSITVTEKAAQRLKEVKSLDGNDKPYLRISVKGGGCSGFQYCFDLDDTINEDDLVIEQSGEKILIDSISQMYLDEVEIDFKNEIMASYFEIKNPHVSSKCGCGMSFTV